MIWDGEIWLRIMYRMVFYGVVDKLFGVYLIMEVLLVVFLVKWVLLIIFGFLSVFGIGIGMFIKGLFFWNGCKKEYLFVLVWLLIGLII